MALPTPLDGAGGRFAAVCFVEIGLLEVVCGRLCGGLDSPLERAAARAVIV